MVNPKACISLFSVHKTVHKLERKLQPKSRKTMPLTVTELHKYPSLEAVDKSSICSANADNEIYDLSISNQANNTIFPVMCQNDGFRITDITETSFKLMHPRHLNIKIVMSMIFVKQ